MVFDVDIVSIKKDAETQVILGHAGFIKSAEDLYEAMINSVPNIKFGLAFAEASGKCLIRIEGNDEELRKLAEENMLKIGSGHTFIILFKEAYPINVLNHVKNVNEVSTLYCATANPVKVVVAKSAEGRGIIGIIDGAASKGVEQKEDKEYRHKFLRDLGYKK